MSFNTTTEENTSAAETTLVPSEAPATQALATVASGNSAMQGEFTTSDLRLPRINLVQKMSELAESFKFGDVVFEKTMRVGGLENPLPFTVLRLVKQYQQDLPYGSEEMPQVYNTSEEVRAAGGSVVRGAPNYFSEIAHIQMAIAAPEEIDEEMLDFFPYSNNGKSWAKAVMTVSRSAYSTLAKPLITHGFNTLRDGFHNGLFELHVDLKKSAKGNYVVPVPVYKGRHTQEDAAFFTSLL